MHSVNAITVKFWTIDTTLGNEWAPRFLFVPANTVFGARTPRGMQMVHQNIRKPSCTCRYLYKTDSFNMAHPPRTCWEVLWWGRSKWQSRPQILQGSWVCRAASRGRYGPTPRPGRYVGDGPGYEDHPLVWCLQLPSGHSVHLKEDLTIHDIIIVQNNKLTVLYM